MAQRRPTQPERPRAQRGPKVPVEGVEGRQTQLLVRIRDFLKQLPRVLRNEVISNFKGVLTETTTNPGEMDGRYEANSAT